MNSDIKTGQFEISKNYEFIGFSPKSNRNIQFKSF